MKSISSLVWIIVLVISVIVIMFLGCSKSNNSSSITTDSTRTFHEIIDAVPVKGLTKESYAGKFIYAKYCVVCHGAEGDGKGFNAFNLQSSFAVQPANFTDSTFMKSVTDEIIIKAITEGGRSVNKTQYMPPWGETLNREEIENVVAYIKVFSRLKALEDLSK